MTCVCGKEWDSTASGPWMSMTLDSYGKIISGTCIHGVYFPPIKKEDSERD